MKLRFISVVLALFTSIGFANEVTKAEPGVDIKSPITPSFYSGVIHLSDLDTSADSDTGMFTIQSSGRYYVSGDLSLAPGNARVAGIMINADNVLLDLNQTTIFQRVGNSQVGCRGIEVASGKKNITIKNGSISGLTGNGIHVEINCGSVVVEDIIVQSCASSFDATDDGNDVYGGILLNGTSGNEVRSSILRNVYISQCNASGDTVAGLSMNYCNNVTVVDSFFNDNRATANDNIASGVFMANCVSCEFKNCEASGNEGDGTGNGYGFDLSAACSACSFENCIASNNKGQPVYGFYVNGGLYNIFTNCSASYQQANGTAVDSSSYGFYSTDGTGNAFEECRSCGNLSGDFAGVIGAGFGLDGTEQYTSILNCVAEANGNVPVGTAGLAYGFDLGSSTVACHIEGNKAISNVGVTSGSAGFRDQVTESTNVYIKNFAHSNSGDGTVSNYSIDPSGVSGFPLKGGNYDDLTGLDASVTGYFSVEIS